MSTTCCSRWGGRTRAAAALNSACVLAAVLTVAVRCLYLFPTLQNDWTYWCGVGVFHSGVEVYGIEYAFGGE